MQFRLTMNRATDKARWLTGRHTSSVRTGTRATGNITMPAWGPRHGGAGGQTTGTNSRLEGSWAG